MSVPTSHTPWTPFSTVALCSPSSPVVAHRWFARFHSLVQRTLGSMMKLNWGNFARHRESWLVMMMIRMTMMMRMMMIMMAAINNVIHKHQEQQLACSVGRLVATPSSFPPGLGLNPILVPLSHSSVWDFSSTFFFIYFPPFLDETKANVNFSTLPFGLFKNLNLSSGRHSRT